MTINETYLIQSLRVKYSDQDTTRFNVLDFVSAVGSPLDALMYSRLFWPEFVEIDEMIFLKETVEDHEDKNRILQVLKGYDGDRSMTEKSFNLFEIPSGLFGRKIEESTDEEDESLAEILVDMWNARLKQVFPERMFSVELLKPEETGGEIGVIFYQT